MENAKECLALLNKIIVLPDLYYFDVGIDDNSQVTLYKSDFSSCSQIIEKFILENYDYQSIVELGLEIGEIIFERNLSK